MSEPSGRYFTGKPCIRGHISERNSKNRECIACALERSARDPNKAFRTKMSAQRNKAKRAADARERNSAKREQVRAYQKAYRAKNIDAYKAREAEQGRRHAEKRRAYAIERYKLNRDAVRQASKKWGKANPHLVCARTARRKAARLRATPAWADHSKIDELYALARELTLSTGIRHEVDHIIPLQGETVCGLHVHNNLQILTQSENARKRNKLIDAALAEKE